MTRRMIPLCLALAASAGCAFGDYDLGEIDPAAAPERPTWSEDVAPIIDSYCASCHRAGGPSGDLGYETCEGTRRGFGSLWSTVADRKSMPPGGAPRLHGYELLVLDRWEMNGGSCD